MIQELYKSVWTVDKWYNFVWMGFVSSITDPRLYQRVKDDTKLMHNLLQKCKNKKFPKLKICFKNKHNFG